MNHPAPDEATLQRLSAEIDACTPRPHHAGLLAAALPLIGPCRFALTRGGWYRSGGLIGAAGLRVTEKLDDWVRLQLTQCGEDLGEFLERHHGHELLATRHNGRTHYFVSPCGPAPWEFLQLEVEELQEVLDRRLWDEASPPNDVQELIDPLQPASVPAQAVGAPYYRFRLLIDMRRVIARLQEPVGSAPGLVRFMQEWAASHPDTHFSEHWIVALRDHHDRYNNAVVSATPISLHARELKPFHWNSALRGLDAARQLQSFDRAAGFAGAWYFHLVAGGLTPRVLAPALMHDIESGFGYLGDAETALLTGWLRVPYSL